MARAHRRVRTEPQPGVDPNPQQLEPELAVEDRLEAWGDPDLEELEVRADDDSDSNEARLLGDVPPHNV